MLPEFVPEKRNGDLHWVIVEIQMKITLVSHRLRTKAKHRRTALRRLLCAEARGLEDAIDDAGVYRMSRRLCGGKLGPKK